MASAPIKYRRILLKVSGESLAGEKKFGLDPATLRAIAREIKDVADRQVDVGIVVGGGNIFRGLDAAARDRPGRGRLHGHAGHRHQRRGPAGRLGKSRGAHPGHERHCDGNEVAEPYIRRRAMRHLEKGRIVIFAAGTGNPYFTTDTAAALRATEIGAEAVLKATGLTAYTTATLKKTARPSCSPALPISRSWKNHFGSWTAPPLPWPWNSISPSSSSKCWSREI